MPLPYSVDLRERVLLAHEHGEGNAAALAARFGVAVNTVKNWVRAAATEGRRVAKPRGRGPAPRQLVAADNDATLAELARGWRRRPGSALADRCSVSPSSGWACRAKNPSGERADARRCRRRARLLCRTVKSIAPRTSSLSMRAGSASS
jgi:transposase-like protein